MLSSASHITKIIVKLCAGKPHAQFERGLHGNGPAVTLEPRHNLPMSHVFLEESSSVLARTPAVLTALLRDLPEAWTLATEGEGTWSPYDVVGHLIHAEETDWMPRLAIILEHGPARPFEPFDREAMFDGSEPKSLPALLDEFAGLRSRNLVRLRALNLQPEHLELRGTHPALGTVTLRQLLATWTAHDLGHLVQVSRVMARRYQQEVGPWAAYLSVMK